MERSASPPCGVFDFDQQIPLMQHGIRGIYLCHIRVYRIDDQRSTINEKTRLMHPNCRRGSLPKMRGSRLSAVPFCISILTSVRRIVKIAVRFLHTKTALCDRKDTQSRFAVNAARSIVCVETSSLVETMRFVIFRFNAARSIVCVETCRGNRRRSNFRVSMPHAALCVLGQNVYFWENAIVDVSMPHAALCVLGRIAAIVAAGWWRFNAARSIVCVETAHPCPRGGHL